MRKYLIAMCVAVVALSGCNTPGTFWEDGKVQVVQIHAEWELTYEHFWEIKPPDRLDIIMVPDGLIPPGQMNETAEVRCDNMGGRLIYYPRTQQSVCEGIDY